MKTGSRLTKYLKNYKIKRTTGIFTIYENPNPETYRERMRANI